MAHNEQHEHGMHHEHDMPEEDGIASDEITPIFAPAVRPTVGSAILDDEALLLDESGVTHLLNPPATLVFRCFDGDSPINEIAADIAAALAADEQTVESDIVGFVRQLGAHGLLAGVRRSAPVHRQTPTGLAVGTALTGIAATLATGESVDTTALLTGSRTVLVNWSPRCGFCTRIATKLSEATAGLAAADARVLLLVSAPVEETLTHLQANSAEDLSCAFVESPPEFFAGIGTPAAYLVAADGTVAEPLAIGADQVPVLVDRIVAGDVASL